jgi:hypothetical protein
MYGDTQVETCRLEALRFDSQFQSFCCACICIIYRHHIYEFLIDAINRRLSITDTGLNSGSDTLTQILGR